MNKSNTNEIASTILIALGGHPFVTMTGAKEFVAEGNALMFKIPRNKSRANHIKIVYNGQDSFTIYFIHYIYGRFTKNCAFTNAKVQLDYAADVNNSTLHSVFKDYTGLGV